MRKISSSLNARRISKNSSTDFSKRKRRKKLVNIIVVAEGDRGAEDVAKVIKERVPTADTRVCVLGHIQRGGAPTCMDRLIASRMGYSAVECLIEGRHNVMIGIVNNKMHYTPLEKAVKAKQRISEDWLKIVKILAS
ncbi:6-phosphofructokinase [Puia sp. P3]|uniref:6-phosphofructokinase n=1 Tax=Puia sp. P3 TaxID=3423952 RepID=UPI003D67C54E